MTTMTVLAGERLEKLSKTGKHKIGHAELRNLNCSPSPPMHESQGQFTSTVRFASINDSPGIGGFGSMA